MNDPGFRQQFVAQQTRELERRARQPRAARPARTEPAITFSVRQGDPVLERLAQLDDRPLPAGRFVVAEVNGEVVAALPLCGGAVLGDPFRKTAHLLPLLQERARQLRPRRRPVLRWRAA